MKNKINQSKSIKVKVISEKCLGCGTCASILPQIFELNENGISQVKSEYKDKIIKDSKLIAKIEKVKDMCPHMAIEIEEMKII